MANGKIIASFTMPGGACNAHFHVFEPGFLHVPDSLYTFPDATLQLYLRMTDVLGIQRMVLVQPTYYGIDNSLLVQTLREIGPQCRGVVRVADEAGSDELDRYHRAGIRAIRLDHFARASWPTGTSSPISARSPTVPGRADDICSSTPLAPSSGSAALLQRLRGHLRH
jgi:hypothetical protein